MTCFPRGFLFFVDFKYIVSTLCSPVLQYGELVLSVLRGVTDPNVDRAFVQQLDFFLYVAIATPLDSGSMGDTMFTLSPHPSSVGTS